MSSSIIIVIISSRLLATKSSIRVSIVSTSSSVVEVGNGEDCSFSYKEGSSSAIQTMTPIHRRCMGHCTYTGAASERAEDGVTIVCIRKVACNRMLLVVRWLVGTSFGTVRCIAARDSSQEIFDVFVGPAGSWPGKLD